MKDIEKKMQDNININLSTITVHNKKEKKDEVIVIDNNTKNKEE